MVCESENRGFDGGVAVEEEISGIEAIEDEIDGGDGEEKKGEEVEKNWEFQSRHWSRDETEEFEKKGKKKGGKIKYVGLDGL